MALLRVPAWLSAVLVPVAAIESGIGFSSRFWRQTNGCSLQFQTNKIRVRAAAPPAQLIARFVFSSTDFSLCGFCLGFPRVQNPNKSAQTEVCATRARR
jgi:hypothetical protein